MNATRPGFTHFSNQTRCNRCDAWMNKGKHHSHDCPPKAEEVTEDHIEGNHSVKAAYFLVANYADQHLA